MATAICQYCKFNDFEDYKGCHAGRDLVQNGVLLAEKVTNVHRQLARFVKTVRAENAAFWLAMCYDIFLLADAVLKSSQKSQSTISV